MSDLFLSAAFPAALSSLERELRFTPYTQIETSAEHGFSSAVSRVDDWSHWGPAWDDGSQTRVLLAGRISLDEPDWLAAERLPYRGGLASRWLLDRWLARGEAGVSGYNGAALVAILDHRNREAHVWTDRLGFFPAFVSTRMGAIVASHPDVIARACASAGRTLEIDSVTLAEMLRTGNATHPNTYWAGISQLDGGTHFVLSGDGQFRAKQRYWRPAYMDGAPPFSRPAFVDEFAHAMKAAGRRRSLSRFGKTAVLLSSGADSRGVLCATGKPAEVDCITYFDEPNAELEGAQRIASLAGAQHFALQRSADYYVRHAERNVLLSGGMWGLESGHHVGFSDEIRTLSRPGTVLTGCYCDYLFKGLALNRRHLRMLGRNLPLYETQSYRHAFYQPYSPLNPSWEAQVDTRLDLRFPLELRDAEAAQHIEFLRLDPLAREADASGRLSLWRVLPFDVIVADADVLDVYGRLSVADKVSGVAFGQAVASIAGAAIAAVPNSNFGAPVGTTEFGRVTAFMRSSLTRKIRKTVSGRSPVDAASVSTSGSWPNLTQVALSNAQMRAWFEKIRAQPMLADFLHPSRRAWPFEVFATKDVFQLFRLVTAHLWLEQAGADKPMIAGPAAHALTPQDDRARS